jgi:hypothetical protein
MRDDRFVFSGMAKTHKKDCEVHDGRYVPPKIIAAEEVSL